MVKPREEVISEFNILTNMSVDELQEWLENPQSKRAGTGVGLESAERIVGILKKNPTKDPEQYDDEDIEHMRKVVSYDKRHIAQEEHLKETKTKEELENTKSTISMKNWGHDPIKELDADASGSGKNKTGQEPQEETKTSRDESAGRPAEETKEATNEDAKHTHKRKLDSAAEEDTEAIQDTSSSQDAEGEPDEEDETRARKKSKAHNEPELTEESVDAAKGLLA